MNAPPVDANVPPLESTSALIATSLPFVATSVTSKLPAVAAEIGPLTVNEPLARPFVAEVTFSELPIVDVPTITALMSRNVVTFPPLIDTAF